MNTGYITRLTASPTIRFMVYWKEGIIICGSVPIRGWCGSMFARIQYRPTASKVTWKWLSSVMVLSLRTSRQVRYSLAGQTDSLQLPRTIICQKNICLLCISTVCLFLVKNVISMISCKDPSKRLWCLTIARTSSICLFWQSIISMAIIILTLIR